VNRIFGKAINRHELMDDLHAQGSYQQHVSAAFQRNLKRRAFLLAFSVCWSHKPEAEIRPESPLTPS